MCRQLAALFHFQARIVPGAGMLPEHCHSPVAWVGLIGYCTSRLHGVVEQDYIKIFVCAHIVDREFIRAAMDQSLQPCCLHYLL